ncbi:MAG: zf-HC2 domain-containing protein [Planctomycetes bacterium]|nr:zf-HC2 domain-containing protein [Planctomycetota bacterium]
MDCKRILDLLPEYLDRRLGPDLAVPVRDHLEACSGCRREQAPLKETWELLLHYPPIEADILGRVRRRVRGPLARVFRVAAPLAAAAAVVITVGVLMGHPAAPEGADPVVRQEIDRMTPEDRDLFLELTREDRREWIEEMELIGALELVAADRLSEGQDPFDGH